MTKPQTDLEDLRELNAEARAFQEKRDARVNVRYDETVALSPDELKARSRRNLWIALSIGAFMLLVFAITLTQMQAGVLERPL